MLNDQQKASVEYIEGPLLVLAGAGSGKTRVITHKIAYMINGCSYPPPSIYALTFTNKAANAMRSRVAALLPADRRRGLKIGTFHTLGLQIIKRHVNHCHLKKGFTILDSDDSLMLIRSFLPTNKAQDREFTQKVQQALSGWKNTLLGPDKVAQLALDSAVYQQAAILYPLYQKALQTYNAVDFDDLIRLPVQLLENHPELLEYWQNSLRHLLVDEYQDSNTSQYRLIQLLTGVAARFTVVGDDDQSIYAWRGARPENLLQLQTDYPHLKVITLEQNYRSTTRILQSANQLIANNPHLFAKQLWSQLGSGDLLRILCCKDEQDEAEQVVTDLISHSLRSNTKYGDYALLYRNNHQARVFEKILQSYGIAYKISGGESWFAKMEVKDTFAYIRLLCNESDDAAFLRIINSPKRGIGEASLNALRDYAQKRELSLFAAASHLALTTVITEKPLQALLAFKSWMEGIKKALAMGTVEERLKQMVDESGYEAHVYEQHDTPNQAQKRMDNVWELIAWIGRLLAKKPEQSLSDVVNKLILIDMLEQSDKEDEDTLQLMTLHASKGLEFPYVYLVGMEEELLPHKVSLEEDYIEEERRLAYVGITRAQRGLTFSLAKQRRRGGELRECLPSRFLDELPADCLTWFGRTTSDANQAKHIAKTHLDGLKKLLEEKA